MQYVIDDTPIIEADVLVKQPPLISSEVLVPIKTISHEETPTISALQIIDYSSSSIECAFDVTTEQAEEVVKGVLCGTTNPPTFENADYRLLHGQGSMDLAFAGLHKNTEYYLRPYALSNLGYKYGDIVAQRTKASPIPDEYQLVEYLQGDGNSYIDTGIFNSDISILVKGQFLRNKGFLFGNTWPSPSNSNIFCLFASIFYRVSSNVNFSWEGSIRNYEFKIEDNSFYIDGELIRTFSDYQHFVTYSSLTLFHVIDATAFNDSTIIYHCVINNSNGIALRDFYSVYRKSDGEPGMYDIINNTFYINAGTGEFIIGPDKEWEE